MIEYNRPLPPFLLFIVFALSTYGFAIFNIYIDPEMKGYTTIQIVNFCASATCGISTLVMLYISLKRFLEWKDTIVKGERHKGKLKLLKRASS